MLPLAGPILAAVRLDDTSADPIRQAANLAQYYDVELHICHVLPDLLSVRPLFPQVKIEEAFRMAELEASVQKVLVRLAKHALGTADSRCRFIVENGSVHSAILRSAERIQASLLVVGHGRGSSQLSGVSERIVRYAHCPVLVVRPSPSGQVLAATDYSDPALPAIEAGVQEAARRHAELVLLHSIEMPMMNIPSDAGSVNVFELSAVANELRTLSPPHLEECVSHYVTREGKLPEGSAAEVIIRDGKKPAATLVAEEMACAFPSAELAAKVRELSQKQLDDCVARFSATRGILAEGPAGEAIVRAAEELPAALVVVGTHGKTGMDRLMLGSVAETVVREALCSVLVVRLKS